MTAAADPASPPLLGPSAAAPAQPRLSLVPEGYAQKAMASLMQLHAELMDEKERRVDLHCRLMEKEQALAELKMYVKMLEEKVEQRPPARSPVRHHARPPPPPPPVAAKPKLRMVSRKPSPPRVPAPARAASASPPPLDGWRSW
jgi:hypothetical protein